MVCLLICSNEVWPRAGAISRLIQVKASSMRLAHQKMKVVLALAACLGPAAEARPQGQATPLPQSKQSKTDLNPTKPAAPRTVYVAVEKAEIYSGPSSELYPTGFVAHGNAIEVYHRTQDGWLGIRPPKHSFSWVPAEDAYLLPGGKVIEITGENAVSWIGTALGSAKQYRWQVKLNPGEQLSVLGEMVNKDSAAPKCCGTRLRRRLANFVGFRNRPYRLVHQRLHRPSSWRATSETVSEDEGRLSEPQDRSPSKPQDRSPSKPQAGAASQATVLQADYTQDVFAGESIVYDDPSYVDGEFMDGGILEGTAEVYQGTTYVDGLPVRSANSWDGWHALELTDEGFRSRLLEKRFKESQARAAVDPLNHDPFDLSMAKRTPPSMPPPLLASPLLHETEFLPETEVFQSRRHTPWRDPRTLRAKRMRGYPSQSLSENLDAAREKASAS